MCWSGPTSGRQGASTCPTTPSGDTAYTYNPKNQTSSIKTSGIPTGFGYDDADQTERTSPGRTSFVNTVLGPTRQTGSVTFGFTRDPNGNLVSMRTGSGTDYYVLDAQVP